MRIEKYMEKIGANVFVETVYPGVNVGCVVTAEGSICVDTPFLPGEAQRWRARIRSLGGEPVRFVVYTSGQCERTLGTQYLIHTQPHPLRRCDSSVIAHKLAWAQVQEHRSDSFKQSMMDTLADRDPDIANLEVIPPQITLDASLKLYVGHEVITLWATAKGMLWIWLSKRDVLFAGDTVVVGTHPALTVTDTKEWLLALAQLRRERRFRNAVIVPGRGPLCDTSATKPLTAYLRKARDRTRRICRAGRPKADLNGVVGDLLPLYPVANGRRERVQRQIKLGLDNLYDEFKAADAADPDVD
jgi:glyoxylase-like metal-dependent hydrolase (beta-lactamase superfamily II)